MRRLLPGFLPCLLGYLVAGVESWPVTCVTWCSDRWCLSDEHYISVLLAAHGEEASCSCSVGGLTTTAYAEFDGSPHPKVFASKELNLPTIRRTRLCPSNVTAGALAGYPQLLVAPGEWTREACAAATAALAARVATPLAATAANGSATAAGIPGGEDEASFPPVLPAYRCMLALRKVPAAAAGAAFLKVQQQGVLSKA